jgi:hypothetical protein
MRAARTHAERAVDPRHIAEFVTAVTAGRARACFLDAIRARKQWVGIMTRKINLDRYDLVIAAAFALFALVAVSLVLTS